MRHKGIWTGALTMGLALSAGASTWAGLPQRADAAQGVASDQVAQADATFLFDIAPQSLADALPVFGQQAELQISADSATLDSLASPGVRGRMPAAEALTRLLAGTGLTWRFSGPDTVVLDRVSADGAMLLSPVTIEGAALGVSTEGTGSYTTGATGAATGLTMSLRETPQSVTVMTRSRIEDQNLDEIGDVLDQTVGVSANVTSSLGTDGVKYYSRGFEVENYQVDGVSRPTTIYGFETTTADTALYDRIEIVRGATGLLNGVGTPSATVNLVRKRPTSTPQAHVMGQIGSWRHGRAEADVSGPLVEDGRLRARIVAAKQDNETYIDREHIEKQAFYGVVDGDIGDSTTVSIGLDYQEFENSGASRDGLPPFFTDGTPTDFSRSTNLSADWSQYDRHIMTLRGEVDHAFDNGWTTGLDVEYMQGEYDETLAYLWGGSVDRDGSGMLFYAGRWAGDLEQISLDASAEGPFTLFGREHELMLGASYSVATDEGRDYPAWWNGPDYRYAFADAFGLAETGRAPKPELDPLQSRFGGEITQTAAYLATRLRPVDGVAVILGSRLTNWKETEWTRASSGAPKIEQPVSKETGVLTPYAGLVVDLTSNVSAYASYTDIFDPQSNEDLSGQTLDPMVGSSYEAGLKSEWYNGRLNASAAIFQVEQSNLAVALPGAINPNGKQAYRSEDGTVSRGFELELSGEVLTGWQVGGGYSRTLVEDSAGDALLTNIPENMLKLFSTYRLPGAWNDLILGANLRWQGEVYHEDDGGTLWPNNDVLTQGAVTVVDLMARYEIDPLTLTLNVDNVFDKTYYSGFGSMVRYGEPRSFQLTARYDF